MHPPFYWMGCVMRNSNQNQRQHIVEKSLHELFSPGWLREKAKETGVIQRERKIDPVILFWVLVLGFGVRLQRNLANLRRNYEEQAATELCASSFYERFSPAFTKFLHECVLHGIEAQAQQPGRILKEKLEGFKDLLIQDSTIIRLHEKLANKWPAARTRRIAAGVKVSLLVSAVADGAHRVKLVAEKTAEIKTLKIGSWVKDRILLIDLGFFKYQIFDRIEKHGGYFVSRLKGNTNPLIVGVHRKWRGRTIPVVGEKLRDILPRLKRGVLDVEVEVSFSRRAYRGKKSNGTQRFRLVGIYNEEEGKYHLYLTNILPERLSAEDIALLYRARWEVELIFKELKSRYGLDVLPSANPQIIEAFLWIGILTLLVSRRVFLLVRSYFPEKAKRFTHMRWATIFAERSPRLLDRVLEHVGLEADFPELLEIYGSQAVDPNVNRKRLMEEWVA